MQNEDKKAVIFTVSTFKDLREDTDVIIRWFEEFAEKFSYNGRRPKFFGVGSIDGRDKNLKYNRKNWESIKKSLYEGKINDLVLAVFTDDDDYNKARGYRPDAMLKAILCTKQINIETDRKLEREHNIKRHRANEFTFVMKKGIFEEDIETIVLFMKEVYSKLDGIYGYIDYIEAEPVSGVSTKSPVETIMRIDHLDSNFNKIVRGYFWGNILNETHVEALGSEEYVKQNIPCYKFEILKFDEKKAYYIQLTEDIFTFEPEKVLALKEFLKPILYEEDMREIALFDSGGRIRELNRLVFNKEDTTKLLEAQKYPKEELRKILFEERNAKNGEKLSDDIKEYKPITFTALDNADPSCLNITIYFEAINENQFKECVDVIQSWETVGIFGGFGESFHYLFGVGKEENGVSFRVDMGSADLLQAMTTLEKIVNKFAELNDLTIKAMILGDEE